MSSIWTRLGIFLHAFTREVGCGVTWIQWSPPDSHEFRIDWSLARDGHDPLVAGLTIPSRVLIDNRESDLVELGYEHGREVKRNVQSVLHQEAESLKQQRTEPNT